MDLLPCPSCARHVEITSRACPFCDWQLGAARAAPPVPALPYRQLGRAAVLLGASLTLGACDRITGNDDPPQPPDPTVQATIYGGPPQPPAPPAPPPPTEQQQPIAPVPLYGLPPMQNPNVNPPTPPQPPPAPPIVPPPDPNAAVPAYGAPAPIAPPIAPPSGPTNP